ncbi:MFS transporter [Salipaludibacillus sp. CUR1]|uniref:MFS transporter n=1 Tax=Salipaludibacillus sp. CUR1 TaxID=2820003 RepID=UPI001E59D420|nr:MFS transporter [Salipaludibacillus sp. CUR1]MCE7792361.1 MFS transporter [Salipaludibacillus sp. CUR1]
MTKLLYIIIAVAFLDTFIQLPIITPYAQELGASHMLTGAIIAVYSLSNMAGNIVAGHWIDRVGRKKILLAGMASAALILLFYPLAQTGSHLFFIRLLHGLAGGALIPAAFAYIGDRTSEGRRGKTMAYTGACIGSAAIVGPALGGIIAARASVEYVFILVSVLFIITFLLIIKFVNESFSSPDRGKILISDFIRLIKQPVLIQASLAAFALMVSNGTLAFALPLKVASLNLDASATGLLLSTFGLVALLVFLTPANKIFERYEPAHLILTGLVLISVSLIMLSLLELTSLIVLSMVVYGAGFSFTFPSMNRMVADMSTVKDRGKAYGIFYAAFSLGVVSGSFIAGTVAELLGFPFLVSAGLMLSAGAVLYFISSKKSKKSSPA